MRTERETSRNIENGLLRTTVALAAGALAVLATTSCEYETRTRPIDVVEEVSQNMTCAYVASEDQIDVQVAPAVMQQLSNAPEPYDEMTTQFVPALNKSWYRINAGDLSPNGYANVGLSRLPHDKNDAYGVRVIVEYEGHEFKSETIPCEKR